MTGNHPLWVEGEKIPDDRLGDIYQQPPGVPSTFLRSHLIIGARGVGKTTFFRHQKVTHEGLSIHVSLATEFASLTKQIGLGPLAFDSPPSMEPLLVGKASSLLALSLFERLSAKGVIGPADLLVACLPEGFRHEIDPKNPQVTLTLKRSVASAALPLFEGISEIQPLPNLVSALGERSKRERGPLLLLLDRADMVLTPALVPVVELLDQSKEFIALVAMRPGHIGETLLKLTEMVVAGDHYGIVHLGTNPRSREWLDFVQGAVSAQVNSRERRIPQHVYDRVIALSRDSIRTALEVFGRYVTVPETQAAVELTAALEDLRENLLTAAQSMLQKYHPDFRQFVNECRDEVIGKSGTVQGPVVVSINNRPTETLFDQPSRLNRFVELALRCGAFCMREGDRWVPGRQPTEVEIPPLLIWHKSDNLWSAVSARPTVISRREKDILASRGGPAKPSSLFIAYRMKNSESKKFRTELEEAIYLHPDLAGFLVKDGHVPAGTQWAELIREKIRSCKVVIGDVTGMRPDVLFELGFAYGLGRVIIPVISQNFNIAAVPRWLGATQLGTFGDRTGLTNILTSISAHLLDPEYSRPPLPPQPIPGLTVWLRSLPWNTTELDRFQTVAQREDLKYEIKPESNPDESVIRRAASANLLVVSLDGTEADALIHYICGAVIARPRVGYAHKLPRRILILQEKFPGQGNHAADSLSRCHDVVRLVTPGQLDSAVQEFSVSYRRWASDPGKRKKSAHGTD